MKAVVSCSSVELDPRSDALALDDRSATGGKNVLNAFTIDLEEWFCVSNFEGVIKPEEWPNLESRVEDSTNAIIELLDRHQVKATFFVLAWVAERHPDLIRSISDRGHEIATHGYGHRLVYELTPSTFDEDIERSLSVIREITGKSCIGYRAPSFSLRRDMDWAWEVLNRHGIQYDSSIFPVVHDRYGEPDAPRFPFEFRSGEHCCKEFPMSTVTRWGKNLPVAGGGYLRLYPYWLTRWAIRKINHEGHPAMVYIHPWEVDPQQPRPAVSKLKLMRHRIGMSTVMRKLEKLLQDFSFGPACHVLDRALSS